MIRVDAATASSTKENDVASTSLQHKSLLLAVAQPRCRTNSLLLCLEWKEPCFACRLDEMEKLVKRK
ncbi:hypothetical protein V2J09_017777 [Rumex salicifolius]